MLSESSGHTFASTNVFFDSLVSDNKLWQQQHDFLQDAARYSDHPLKRITKYDISL
jgi:hypothetical protein